MEIIEIAKHNLFFESVVLSLVSIACLIGFFVMLYYAIKDDLCDPFAIFLIITLIVGIATAFPVIDAHINYDRALESRIDSVLLEQKRQDLKFQNNKKELENGTRSN